jgi:hypothetical protein
VQGATEVTCTNKVKQSEGEAGLDAFPGGGDRPTRGTFGEVAFPTPEIAIAVDVQPGAEASETNSVGVAGGGAPASAEANDTVVVSASKPPYELTTWNGWFSNADGTIDQEAGSHPYAAYFNFALATALTTGDSAEVAGGEIRTAEVEVPPGVIGDPTAVPQCARERFVAEQCPSTTVIGTTTAYFTNFRPIGFPVFNLVPPPGVPAEFGFSLQGLNTFLDASVRTGSDYGINVHVSSIAHKEIAQAITTLWGQPGDSTHNRWRSGAAGGCPLEELEEAEGRCSIGRFSSPRPFLTLPTSCGNQLPFVLRTTGYNGATSKRTFYMQDQNGHPITIAGCESLAFSPTVTIQPELAAADSPTGLSVDVTPSLAGLQEARGRSASAIRNATVSLPVGFVANPSQAANLRECSESAAALTTAAEAAAGAENAGPPACPAASKVGIATAKSPLLEAASEKQLAGDVYLLTSNPPHLKLLAALSGDGVNVKIVLNASLDTSTGRIVTTVENAPQLPVSDFSLTFSGGERASVDTPTHCGTFESVAMFTPWTAPAGGDLTVNPLIGLSTGPGGAACPGLQLPFAPALTAGSTSAQAGAFTPFTTQLARGDGQQRVERFQIKTPRGLAGLISSVPLCPEPLAQLGTCPESSQIGHATVTAGPGSSPLVIPQPGEPVPAIYLTGPYAGAPFGLSIVTRALAGPFDLGTIVTRAKIEVDPRTAQVMITTDPLPPIIKGVPTDLRSISAMIDRPNFIFNPTNCDPQTITGTAWGTAPPGASEPTQTAALSSHFGVASCRELAFTPKVAVTTAGQTSKANGASLSFKISYPKGALGTQSWFQEAKFDFPKQLPARLTTLQKACLASVFEANPAACPPASLIGHAVVHTQVLPVPLAGPVYFVSYGGAKFPEAVMVLQGDGVTVDLHGETFISKAGVTSATFRNTPDVPFEDIEVSIPSGRFSEFAANLPPSAHQSLCGQKLVMPTLFKAQNGLEIHQNTRIQVEGCPGGFRVISHRVAGRTLRLAVYAPTAGRLNAAGDGLSAVAKRAGGSETLKLTLHATRSGRFATRLRLSFQPAAPKARAPAKRQTRTLTVRFAK